MHQLPRGLVVRIRRSHRRGRGSIPRTGTAFFFSFLFIEQLPRCTNQIFLCAIQVNFLGSIVVSISACHAEDRGSIPRRGDIFFIFSAVAFFIIFIAKLSGPSNCRDSIVVSTLRCGRNNPGSNPGHGTFFATLLD